MTLNQEQVSVIEYEFNHNEHQAVIDTIHDLRPKILAEMHSNNLNTDVLISEVFSTSHENMQYLESRGLTGTAEHNSDDPIDKSEFEFASNLSLSNLEKTKLFQQGLWWSLPSYNLSGIEEDPYIHKTICDSFDKDAKMLPHPKNYDLACVNSRFGLDVHKLILKDMYQDDTMNIIPGALDILGAFYEVNSWQFNLFLNWFPVKTLQFHRNNRKPKSFDIIIRILSIFDDLDRNRFTNVNIDKEAIMINVTILRLSIAMCLIKHGAPLIYEGSSETLKVEYENCSKVWKCCLHKTKLGFDIKTICALDHFILSVGEMGMVQNHYLSASLHQSFRGQKDHSNLTIKAIDDLNIYLDRAEIITSGLGLAAFGWSVS